MITELLFRLVSSVFSARLHASSLATPNQFDHHFCSRNEHTSRLQGVDGIGAVRFIPLLDMLDLLFALGWAAVLEL